MKVARFTVAAGAALALAMAACSAGATPTVVDGSPSPSASSTAGSSAQSVTPNLTADASAEAEASTTPQPVPPGAATPAPSTSAHLLTLGPVGSAQLQVYKHGAYLLYETTIALPDDVTRPQAWVIKPDGAGARKVAEGTAVGPLSPPAYNLAVRWSHSGSVIHVVKGCTPAISDVSVAGWATTPRATMTDKDEGFVWSPNEGTIYYWHYSGLDVVCEQNSVDDTRDFRSMKFDGSAKANIKAAANYHPTEAFPDGSALLAYDNDLHQLKVNVTTGAATALGVTGWPAKLSPDGTKIAWVSSGTVFVRSVSGGMSQNLGAGTAFAWKPDGTALAISSGTLRVATLGGGSVVIYAAPTKSPTWSPDGSKIAFVRTSGVKGVYVIASTGGAATLMPGTSRASKVSWQP